MDTVLSAICVDLQTDSNAGSHDGKLVDDAMKIYQGMQFTMPDYEHTIQEILDALQEYAIGITNETYEHFLFQQRKQEEGESLGNFYSSLRDLSKTCNCCKNWYDSLMRDQTVTSIQDHDTKQNLLKSAKSYSTTEHRHLQSN